MFLRSSLWVLLILLTSACGLEISGIYNDMVICSQGLSQCTMKDEMSFPVTEDNTVDVHKLTPRFKICCRDNALCRLCLVVDIEIYVHLGKGVRHRGSRPDGDLYRLEKRRTRGFVTVCYKTASRFPTCKKLKFKGNGAALIKQNLAKVSVIIIKPDGVFFSSEISVYPLKSPNLSQQVVAPSEAEVCTQEEELVEECQGKEIPRLSNVVFQGTNWVELQFSGRNKSLPSMCIQYEKNGPCQKWNQTVIPLHTLAPCMCLQVWDEQESSWRHLSCPFNTNGSTSHVSIKELIQRNVWQNVSVSVRRGHTNDSTTILWWILSAPCKLEGEVWPCQQQTSCSGEKAVRQQLGEGWKLNRKGLWENQGVFEHDARCVQVKLKGLGQQLGPFCFGKPGRWRWSLLLLAVTLLACFTVLIFYLLAVFTKNGTKGHVVLLSPPEVDGGISQSVCQLGSLLCNRGVSVSLDQWSRKEQCILGPLPWLHSQLLELNSLGGKVVLILTQKALMRTVKWTHQNPPDNDHTQVSWSPHSDVFTACLCLIKAEKQLGTAAKRFLLVTFGSHSNCDMSLPEPLQGLSLFQLPSQTQALLSELGVGRTRWKLGGRTSTNCKFV